MEIDHVLNGGILSEKRLYGVGTIGVGIVEILPIVHNGAVEGGNAFRFQRFAKDLSHLNHAFFGIGGAKGGIGVEKIGFDIPLGKIGKIAVVLKVAFGSVGVHHQHQGAVRRGLGFGGKGLPPCLFDIDAVLGGVEVIGG